MKSSQDAEPDPLHVHALHAPTPSHEVPLFERLLVRPDEAAALLGVGRTMIYEMIKRGDLPVIHIGRAARIAMRDLHLWVEHHRSDTTGEGNRS